MHRVELKETLQFSKERLESVPNAPCGVESIGNSFGEGGFCWFLMHRVELKVEEKLDVHASSIGS